VPLDAMAAYLVAFTPARVMRQAGPEERIPLRRPTAAEV